MGAAKDHWLKQQERGYLDADGGICADCVSDPDLKRWIQDNAVSTTCSFCGREDEDAIAAEMDEFVGAVLDGIRVDWNHPDTEGIAYESAEGGYQADLIDTYEVLEDCGVSDEEDVIQAIVDSLDTGAWVAREFYRGSDSDRLSWGWDSFKETIKHRTRYFFLEGDPYDDMPPARMLEEIADTIRRRSGGMDLIRRLPSDTNILRIRVDARTHDTAATIGTPPAAFAIKSNRMSPAGISMFYGALDVETAIAETREPGDIGKIMSIGTFKPVREISILDLARLPDIPGVFNEAGRELIQPLRFLHPFADDISRPIAHDGREHIEYVPTRWSPSIFDKRSVTSMAKRWTASPTPVRVTPEASRSSCSARTSSASMWRRGRGRAAWFGWCRSITAHAFRTTNNRERTTDHTSTVLER